MSQNTRNPKDLRQMINSGICEHDSTQNTLDKLKSLTEDDKYENAKLRSRIDEQCQLIMILKQRADEGTVRIQALEQINKDLVEFKVQADEMMQLEARKFHLLESRFNSLATNHEEMIRIKDEYKTVNNELREQNSVLKSENDRLFSKLVSEKDDLISELNKKCVMFLEQSSSLEQQLRKSKVEWQSAEDILRRTVIELENNHEEQVRSLKKNVQEGEEKLKETEKMLQSQLAILNNVEKESSLKYKQLSMERDEFMTLSLQRGKLVEEKQEENKSLKKKIEEIEKARKNLEHKFLQEAEAVNKNARVVQLKNELQECDNKYSQLIKEFDAFKKHSGDLLRQEKELNDKLRQLYC